MAAGISHWKLGHFEVYNVNPPLVRMLATVPVLAAGPEVRWRGARIWRRPEFDLGREFVAANGRRSLWLFTLARWATIPLSILGGYFCWLWARELYGREAGLFAVCLWCFSPSLLAYGQLLVPDVGATSIGVAAWYLFWRWLKRPTWGSALWAGVAFGLVQLTKTTWVILFGLWPMVWLVYRTRQPGYAASVRCLGRELCQLGLVLLLGTVVVNAGYGFEGSMRRLGQFEFVSKTLTGAGELNYPLEKGNRFRESWAGALPIPLPANYVLGMDLQRSDFESKLWSYLRGQWKDGGWWYYYLYALAIKLPLGTWGLIVLALLASLCCNGYAASWRDEFVLLAPWLTILVLASSQTGFSHHMRYVLPIFPFAFIWMSKVARAFQFGWRRNPDQGRLPQRGKVKTNRVIAGIAAGALLWSVGSSLWVYPHSLSYFNELVGGPLGGHDHLDNSNIDWGQDLLYLKRWLDDHPEASPLGLAHFWLVVDPRIVGIEYTTTPPGPDSLTARPPGLETTGPLPGWYAISTNELHSRKREYDYFLRIKPAAMAGYSIHIYHVTREDADRVRRELEGR